MGRFISLDGITYKRQPDGSLTPMKDRSDWNLVDAMVDAKVTAIAMSDPDALPMSDEDWKRVKPIKRKKESVTIRIDADVVDFYRSAYPKYQLGMNEVLREGMKNRQKAG